MHNIKLSNEEYYEILSSANCLALNNGEMRLFGHLVKNVSDGFLLYIACEYCGQKVCRCGAPLDWQGKRIKKLPAGEANILHQIIAELVQIEVLG